MEDDVEDEIKETMQGCAVSQDFELQEIPQMSDLKQVSQLDTLNFLILIFLMRCKDVFQQILKCFFLLVLWLESIHLIMVEGGQKNLGC